MADFTSRSLSSSSKSNSPDGSHIVVEIDAADLNEVKRQATSQLAVNNYTTYMAATNATLKDLVENKLVAIDPSDALKVRNYIPDTSSPELSSVEVDISVQPGLIHFNFTETVRADAVNISAITIQSGANATMHWVRQYRLSGGSFEKVDGTTLTLYLSPTDLNTLKAYADIFTDVESTYVSITTAAFRDMNNNSFSASESVAFDPALAPLFPSSPLRARFMAGMAGERGGEEAGAQRGGLS